MATKEEMTKREADAWEAFRAVVARIPEERRETPALEGGWSVKDVLWHVAYWWGDVARASREGWREADQETDDVNERELRKSRALPLAEVLAEVDDSRARLLAAWEVADATDEGIEYYESETIDHYEEHQEQIQRFADDPSVKARGT